MPKAPKTLLDKIIVDKALDRASRLRQQYIRNGMSPEKLQRLEGELIDNLDPIAKRWKPSMRRGWKGTIGIFDTGKFMNQFESNRSGGAFDKEKRRDISKAYFQENLNDDEREKYGFLKRPKKYGLDDVNWYGEYEFSFKPAVRKRMTFINGDSLNEFDKDGYNWRSPSPIVPGVKETYINWTGQPAEGVLAKIPSESRFEKIVQQLKENPGPFIGTRDFEPGFNDYVESQYHGNLTLEDVEGLGSPFWGLEPGGSRIEDPVKEQIRYNSTKYGFPVYDWNGKCIYNCR